VSLKIQGRTQEKFLGAGMFRAITNNDFDIVYDIYMSDSVNPFMSWEKVSKKDFEDCFKDLLSRDEFLAFEENGNLLGLVTVIRGKWRKRHVATLGSLAVSTSYQNKGVGSRMMNLLINSLKDEGIRRLELTVESDNLSAIHLYERLGFQQEGILREYFRRDGHPEAIDDYVMSKLLS
tara:strand:- start:317 stop:850 length:534 start_codon:yes stop_codon:yes gene_type:complete